MRDSNEGVPLRDPHKVSVDFVSEVAGVGFGNGVVNVTFSVALYTPVSGKDEVELDRIVASRLRMDLMCAMNLRDMLTKIIDQNTKGVAQPPAKSEQH